MTRLLLLFMIGCFASAPARAQEETQANAMSVAVKRMRTNDQAFFELRADGFVAAAPQQVWKVLTDYNRLQEFEPNLVSSKIISRNAQETIVEQSGDGGFLFIRKNIHIIVRVIEHPFSTIDVTLVSGDMKQYAMRWELVPAVQNGVSGTRMTYSGMMEPEFFVPPFIGSSIVQADVKKMLLALVNEITKQP